MGSGPAGGERVSGTEQRQSQAVTPSDEAAPLPAPRRTRTPHTPTSAHSSGRVDGGAGGHHTAHGQQWRTCVERLRRGDSGTSWCWRPEVWRRLADPIGDRAAGTLSPDYRRSRCIGAQLL
ncbi:uncharacterized protein [Procambarus clarkii]|uniref:uncharacterized protein n=1 Tax=Procambarus clarkii TaxID=6728 RepID=UPI003743FFA9